MGSKNNLVSVKKSDFEVFQALEKDSESITSSAQTEFGQDIPPHRPWEKVAGPPILPPHLLQVILNKDTPLSVSIYGKRMYKTIFFMKLNTVVLAVRTNATTRAKSCHVKSSICLKYQR